MNDERTENDEQRGYEPIEVNTRGVAVSVAALMSTIVVGLLLIGGVAYLLSSYFGGRAEVAPSTGFGIPGTPPPGVRAPNLRTLRATENRLLTEYAWIDAEAGIARIPISRAMEITAERMGQLAR